jgi:hypothetical protein
MKNPNPLEKAIEAAVCKHARELGMLEYKFTSPARRHVPDRIFIAPGGKVFFVEMKRRGEVATPAQALEHAKFRERGVEVFIVDNVDDGEKLLEKMLTKPQR